MTDTIGAPMFAGTSQHRMGRIERNEDGSLTAKFHKALCVWDSEYGFAYSRWSGLPDRIISGQNDHFEMGYVLFVDDYTYVNVPLPDINLDIDMTEVSVSIDSGVIYFYDSGQVRIDPMIDPIASVALYDSFGPAEYADIEDWIFPQYDT